MPLKKVPRILSADLLHTLASMGHGDEIADDNFPAASICKYGPSLINAKGLGIPELLGAILELLPLDIYVDKPVMLMDLEPIDKERGLQTPVWNKYYEIIDAAEVRRVGVELIERFEFYEKAKKAFAVIHTGETALYGNIILKKGVIASD